MLYRAALLTLAFAALGCSARHAVLEPVEPRGSANVAVELVDRRADPEGPIGEAEHGFTHTSYDIEADGELAPWLEDHVATALASNPPPPAARLDVALLRFDLRGATWMRGEAVFDLTLTLEGGEKVSHRLTVRTTELMTEDGDLAWTHNAAKLARWSALEIARWTRSAAPSG
jgi:hypothetical protein